MKQEIIFATLTSAGSLRDTRLLVESLRAFGGELAEAQVWILATDPELARFLEDKHTSVIPLAPPGRPFLSFFEKKVAACALAEMLAPRGLDSLAWVDESVVITQPPLLFKLGTEWDAAFRPVHIRNVGLPPSEPLDPFWKGIAAAVGVEDIRGTVTSFVDGQRLRTYFNTHAFAIRPGLGLMKRWNDLFKQLEEDETFQAAACADETHQIFLFQALLSTLVSTAIEPGRVNILPPTYNYPYHLQEQIPAERQLGRLDEAVTITHEDRSLRPEKLEGIEVGEPLRSWLEIRMV